MMKRILFFVSFAVIFFGLGLLLSCSSSSGGGEGKDDNQTWLLPDPSLAYTWDYAISCCASLSALGYDDWRLPTISELRSRIYGCDATMTGGSCGVTDDCLDSTCYNYQACGGCDYLAGPGPGDGAYGPYPMYGGVIQNLEYWSSSVDPTGGSAWGVDFRFGSVNDYSFTSYDEDQGKTLYNMYAALCVRP